MAKLPGFRWGAEATPGVNHIAEDNIDSIDELSERIGELSEEDRTSLLETLREDQLSAYLDARGEYMDALREEGLIARYPEDSPWADYCERHPYDPLCQRMVGREEYREDLRKYQRARGRFVDRLQEHGLLSERAGRAGSLVDDIGLTPAPDGAVGPWEPPWWICIRYPWMCDTCFWNPWECFGTATGQSPIPDPGPFRPGSSFGDLGVMAPSMMGGSTGMERMALASMGMEAMASGPMGPAGPMGQPGAFGGPVGGPGGIPGDFGIPPGGFPGPIVPPLDICRIWPHLPQCQPDPCRQYPWLPWCRCPPFCRIQPWHPVCRRCWW